MSQKEREELRQLWAGLVVEFRARRLFIKSQRKVLVQL